MAVAAPPPPLAAGALLTFLVAVLILLLLARTLGRLAERVGLPAVVGELLTGVVVGPTLLGRLAPGVLEWLLPIDQPERIHLLDAVGHLGVLLLVGVTGTHLDLNGLRERRAAVVAVSLSGLILPLALGIGLGAVLPASLMSDQQPDRWLFALFLGVAMCVSAIPVIAKTLTDMRLLHRDIGQLTLAAGMIDDAVGWFLLTVVSAAATAGLAGQRVPLAVAALVGFVVVAATLGRPVVRRVMRLAARSAEPGPTVAAAVLIIIAGAVTTHALGMEPIFGAFVAGLLIGGRRSADQAKLAPLRTVVLSVLAPLFLATAGLRMDLGALADPVVALAAMAVLAIAIVGKFAGAYVGARLSRLSRWEALALGAGMNARGVVEVIVALTGLRLGVLNAATYTIVVLVAIVTSVMAPPLLRVFVTRIVPTQRERVREREQAAWHGLVSTPEDARPGPRGQDGEAANHA